MAKDKADQILQAAPIARMLKRADSIQFNVISKNGYFAEIAGQLVLEFDTSQEADKVVTGLNNAIASVLNTFRTDYEKKIGDLIA